jgi:hypothetical protein
MKKFVVVILSFFTFPIFAQKPETFDLATYTIPLGWKKTNSTANVVSYAITNNQKGTYGQIGIFASTNSKGSLQADFESEWQELVVKTYKPTKAPELTPASSENGWSAQAGVAPFEFNGAQSAAMLVTASNNSRCMSIVVLTNTSDYQADVEKFLESVDLKKIEVNSQPVKSNTVDSSILGTWSMSTSDQSSYRVNNGITNSIVRQYTFNQDGSYTFVTKTFDPLMDKILFGKESGQYLIDGRSITITPQKSVLEAWTKKDGTDKWGNFLSTQNIPLEKVTYQFTKHYFSGIQEWSLVLQASTPTKREGPFSNNLSFNNAYYYSPISANHPVIEQPGNQSVKVDNQKTYFYNDCCSWSFHIHYHKLR